MFNSKARREAIDRLQTALKRHEAVREQVEGASVELHQLRMKAAIDVIQDVEEYVNSLANSPEEFDASVAEFRIEANRFQETVDRVETQAARSGRIGSATDAAALSSP